MNFTVTYRRKDGSLAKEVVAASSRADVISQMKARGVVPQQVTEGGVLASAAGAAKPAWLKGAIAGALVVVLGIVAVFMLMPEKKPAPPAPKPKVEKPKVEKPKVESPKAVPVAPTNVVSEKKVEEPPKERFFGSTNVVWERPANWDQLSRAEKTRIQPVGRVIKPVGWGQRQLFKRLSDKKIERFLRMTPGKLVLGTVRYDEKFKEDFLKSLEEPIEYVEEDTEDDRRIKQAVGETRRALKEAYDRGEDIVEIMNRAEKEAHELAAYKINLRSLVNQERMKGEMNAEQFKDFVDAANKMLSDKGIEPLEQTKIWFHKAKLDAARESAAQEGKGK